VNVRARVPSAAVGVLAATGLLAGSAVAGVAVIDRHPRQPVPTGVVAANRTVPVRTTTAVGVAPLRHLAQPDLLVSSARTIPSGVLTKLQHAARVRSAVTLDEGIAHVAGHRTPAVAADLSSFRAFTPPPTAASDLLWANLAHGDIATSYPFAKAYHLVVGQQVALGNRIVRLGAVADFGLPHVSVVMSQATGALVGLHRDAAVLLSAPGRSGSSLAAQARDVMGAHAQVVPMNQPASSSYTGKPRTYLELYRAAARTCPGLSWTILASIGQVESGHGRNVGPSSAGALGPMQFMPATWAMWGIDADGDHKADIMDPYDAVYSAARYLCYYNPGASLANLKRAVFAYNHADWYVNEVLALAKLYG
jgi:hypothetical protein